MAGRGRGRGKTVSFDVQALGFGRGEALPAASLQPPALFPPQEFKAVPLTQNDDTAYILALKQEFVATLRKSPYYIKESEKRKDIERYSDKYQVNQPDGNDEFVPDWRKLPAELKIKVKKVRKTKSAVKPNIPARKKETAIAESIDVTKTLENLEKKEENVADVGEEGEKEEGEEDKDEEAEDLEEGIYDEDDLEEETDYAMNYFDNGEGYGDDDGDDEEGPVY